MMKSKAALSFVLVLVALLSIFVLRPLFTPDNLYKRTISKLDEKRDMAAALSAATAGTSALISALPQDFATPVAEKIADISMGFVIALVTIYIEKYALVLLGAATTLFVIPFMCILWLLDIWRNNKLTVNKTTFKILALAIASLFLIPLGVDAGDMIESTFKASTEEVYNTTLNGSDEFEGIIRDDRNIFQKIGDGIGDFFSSLFGGASKLLASAKDALRNAIESLAITIVIDCIIPVGILVIYILLVRWVFCLQFSIRDTLSKANMITRKMRRRRKVNLE